MDIDIEEAFERKFKKNLKCYPVDLVNKDKSFGHYLEIKKAARKQST